MELTTLLKQQYKEGTSVKALTEVNVLTLLHSA